MANISIPFINDFPYNDEVKEFDIKYDADKDDYLSLMRFLEKYDDKRINIELKSFPADIELLKALVKVNYEIYFKLNQEFVPQYKQFEEANLNYFFNFFTSNWDAFTSLVNAKVSDIYITGELGFSLKDIKKVLQDTNIRTRAIVNLAQVTDYFAPIDNIKSFFIRPEDLEYYSNYIDTFEFFYEEGKEYQLKTLYKIYEKDKLWFGDLSEIINGLESVDSKRILSDFAFYRINCGKRCLHGSGCNLCGRILTLTHIMEKKDLMFTTNKKGEKENGS